MTVDCDQNKVSLKLAQTLLHEVTDTDQPKLACAETAIYQNKFNEIGKRNFYVINQDNNVKH